jgi:hypothetical protein
VANAIYLGSGNHRYTYNSNPLLTIIYEFFGGSNPRGSGRRAWRVSRMVSTRSFKRVERKRSWILQSFKQIKDYWK